MTMILHQSLTTVILMLICFTYLWINSEPTIWLRRILGFKEEQYDSMPIQKKFLHRLLNCPMCSGYWIGFLCLLPIDPGIAIYAVVVSVGAELLQRLMNKLI